VLINVLIPTTNPTNHPLPQTIPTQTTNPKLIPKKPNHKTKNKGQVFVFYLPLGKKWQAKSNKAAKDIKHIAKNDPKGSNKL